MGIIRKILDYGPFPARTAQKALPAPEKTLRGDLIQKYFARAAFGDLCRTSIFYENEYLDEYKYYQAQAITPTQDRWNIMLVVDRLSSPGETNEPRTRDYHMFKEDVPFFQMVEAMALREVEVAAHQGGKIDEDSLRARNFSGLSAPHFRAFAEREGLLFKKDGMPEPSLRGRIVIPGSYDSAYASLRDQVAEQKRTERAWMDGVLHMTGQALNTKEPFELILTNEKQSAAYRQLAYTMRWMLQYLELRVEQGSIPFEVWDKKRNILKDATGIDTLSGWENRPAFDYLHRFFLKGRDGVVMALDKIKPESFAKRINEAFALMRLVDTIACQIGTKKSHDNLSSASLQIEKMCEILGYSSQEQEMFKTSLITDIPVSVPPCLYEFVESLERFAAQHTKFLAMMKHELTQPDHQASAERVKIYLSQSGFETDPLSEIVNKVFTAEHALEELHNSIERAEKTAIRRPPPPAPKKD